jgi:hypothetical protein
LEIEPLRLDFGLACFAERMDCESHEDESAGDFREAGKVFAGESSDKDSGDRHRRFEYGKYDGRSPRRHPA